MKSFESSIISIALFISILLFFSNCDPLQKDEEIKNITSFLTTYNRFTATPEAVIKADSIGQLVLKLNNSKTNRKILIQYIQKTYSPLENIESLRLKALAHKDKTDEGIAHWLIGQYYARTFTNDSSYYHYNKAETIFRTTNDSLNLAKTLTYKSVILNNNRIFSEAESATVEAISLSFNKETIQNQYMQLLILGGSLSGLGQYEKAQETLLKALVYLNKPEIKQYYSPENIRGNNFMVKRTLINNYIRLKQLDKAKDLGLITLNETQIGTPSKYDKIAQAYLLMSLSQIDILRNDLKKVKENLSIVSKIIQQYNIKDEDHDTPILLSEYYLLTEQKTKALTLLYETLNKVRKNKSLYQEKQILALLLRYGIGNQNNNFNRYEEVTDELFNETTLIKNTFARIKFETDAILLENQKLVKQKQLITINFLGILFILLTLLIVSYVIQKNRQLKTVKGLQKDTEKYYNSILKLQKNIETAQIEERKKISQQLHDGVLNSLFVTRFLLQDNQGLSPENQIKVVEELKITEQYIRDLSHKLVKENKFESHSFTSILENLLLLQNRSKQTKFELILDPSINFKYLNTKTKVNVYHIILEAFQNVHKHSNASLCVVHFSLIDYNLINVTISDNGQGFDSSIKKQGIGLTNIKDRCSLLKATLNIQSSFKQGTTISFTFKKYPF